MKMINKKLFENVVAIDVETGIFSSLVEIS